MMPTRSGTLVAVAFGLVTCLSPMSEAHAQDAPSEPTNGAIRVFLDCNTRGCDQRRFRTDIDWVNWVRDRQDAQVHVIITSLETGGGGREFQLDFIGLESLEGQDDRLTRTSLGTDVRDETVEGLTSTLAVGLARFSVLAGISVPFTVTSQGEQGAPTDRLVTSDQVDDPWNFWVFEIEVSGNFSGESSRKNRRTNGSIEARKTTTTWKMEFDARGSYREDEIELSDSTVVDTRRNWNIDALVVYSLAEHWSLGVEAEANAATRTNQDLSVGAGPALEYSIWPYEEAPRRSLQVRYQIGARYFAYEEETLFGLLNETRASHQLEVSLSQNQPWGSTFGNIEGSQFLHDRSKYRVSSGGRLSFRIFRGLSLRVNGRVSWIRDQLFLSAEGASDEEILLERRRLASDFDWNFGFGLSYQFGSIYNNVVNNRF